MRFSTGPCSDELDAVDLINRLSRAGRDNASTYAWCFHFHFHGARGPMPSVLPSRVVRWVKLLLRCHDG